MLTFIREDYLMVAIIRMRRRPSESLTSRGIWWDDDVGDNGNTDNGNDGHNNANNNYYNNILIMIIVRTMR